MKQRFLKKKLLQIVCWLVLAVGLLILGGAYLVWQLTYHPAAVESLPVVNRVDAPLLSRHAMFSVLNWNVQYMAGKNYVFFYDLLDGSGPDVRPSRADIDATTQEVVRIIREKRPDFILIQELDDGAKRTDKEDQLKKLMALLPPEYGNYVWAWYWKAAFVPHPKIMGSVGMKLAIISRYRLGNARRIQLPIMPDFWLVQQFNFKRAVLEVMVPLAEGGELAVLTTHLDAFAQGSNTMERQVDKVLQILEEHARVQRPFVIGGDFNLLPDDAAYERLDSAQRGYYKPRTELVRLRARFASIPASEDTQGPHFAQWYTHFPNDRRVTRPDRTIDYVFFAGLQVEQKAVLQEGTTHISDHFPIWAVFRMAPLLSVREFSPLPSQKGTMVMKDARDFMVRLHLEGRDITDERVLRVMRDLPREEFVPPDVRDAAYADRPLPIGKGQTISQPYIVAYMTQLLQLRGNEKVLEIGTGSGYQTAVLGQLARKVYSMEIHCDLLARAREVLMQLRIDNIDTRCADGYAGWPEEAPFDAILLTAAPPEIPQTLVDQLATGGRLVAPVGQQDQVLVRITRQPDGSLHKESFHPVRFVPMVPVSSVLEPR